MPATVRGVGTKGEANGGTSISSDVSGSGRQAGDFYVLIASSEDNFALTHGGNAPDKLIQPTAGEEFAAWYGGPMSGSETNLTVNKTSGGGAWVCGAIVVQDADDIADWVEGAGSSSSGAAGSVNPGGIDRLLLMLGGLDDDQTVSGYANASTPETWSEIIEYLTALGTDMMVFAASAARASSADTGACTFTPAGGNPAGAFVLAIPPAAGGSPQTLTPSSVVHTRAIGTATVSPGGVSALPASVVHTRAFGTPRVDSGVAPPSVVHGRAFGTHSVTGGSVTLTPASVVHTRSITVNHVVDNGSGPPPTVAQDSYGPGAPIRSFTTGPKIRRG